MQFDIVTAWQLARDQGQSVALMANSTGTVTRLNHLAQQLRNQRGELDPTGPALQLGDHQVLVGDEVVTRRNDRTLRTDTDRMIKNRDHWTIEAITPDGDLTLTGDTGAVNLSAQYVAEHVELGYAQTSHATQGRTVDIGLALIDTPTDNRGIYTPMTRGRHANHAYVATTDQQTAVDALSEAIGRDWIDKPAVARQAELDAHSDYAELWPSLRRSAVREDHAPNALNTSQRRDEEPRFTRQRCSRSGLDLGR